MEEENKKAASYNISTSNNFSPWWWGTSNSNSNNNNNIIPTTPGGHQSLSADLDEKTKAILSLIIIHEDDGEDQYSFAQRAEMYYKNKPVLVKMVNELHTSYRALAERYDQLRSAESVRIIHNNIDKVSFGSSSSSSSSSSSGDSKLETPYESNPESTVEDPPDQCEISKSADFIFQNRNAELDIGDHENRLRDYEAAARCSVVVVVLDTEMVIDKKKKKKKKKSSTGFEMGQSIHGEITLGSLNKSEDMWTDMNLQVSKLIEENIQQQSELIRRNNEKRETIKDLRFQLDKLTAENKSLQNCLKCSKIGMKQNQSQLSKLKALILGKLLAGMS